MSLTLSPSGTQFLQDGAPFFYLADTIWSAFTNPTLEEWRQYLAYRKRQGFTALQISILPILHDASESGQALPPFSVDDRGRWDFSRPAAAYFERAATMVAMARDAGFVPALVVLWCNYVPDTWAAKRRPEMAMPEAAVVPFVEHVLAVFDRYEPIYIVSGDTDFVAHTSIAYYAAALATIRRLAPSALTTLHLQPHADLPDELMRSPDLDFYMFQSGHHLEEQHRAYTLAELFAGKPARKPAVNGEPCYEGHGHGHRYGRFSAFDVRRAIWQSLLSGAGAGVTYGAHGVWSWHRSGAAFSSEAFSMRPLEWQEALRLEGAWDAGLARALVERYALFGLASRQELFAGPPEIRVAGTTDGERLAIYIPYPTEVQLTVDPDEYRWTVVDLAARHWGDSTVGGRDGKAVVPMHQANSDTLVIGERLRRSGA